MAGGDGSRDTATAVQGTRLMMLLPKKFGPFTLMRKLGSDGVAEAYAGILEEPAGKAVVVRRILPYVVRDPAMLAGIEARVQDLTAVHHPTLVPVLQEVEEAGDRFVVEDAVEAVDLDELVAWCRKRGAKLPHNVYLNLATQICNGLEALHGRPGKASGAENVLHMALRPAAIKLTADGKVLVGEYGLIRSPTSLPHGGVAGQAQTRMEYLAPEQTHPDQALSPSSDIFALGGILYELLTLESLFRSASNLQTIHKVRRAEVTAQLMLVKDELPGLDKVLYRALSLNPRHRYQRAFVLREDLRGLMAGYSFAHIADETRAFLAPLFEARGRRADRALGVADPGGDDTASLLRSALGEPIVEVETTDDNKPFAPPPRQDPRHTLVPADPEAFDDISVTEPGVGSAPPPPPRELSDQTGWIQKGRPSREVTEWEQRGGADPADLPEVAPPADSPAWQQRAHQADETAWEQRRPEAAAEEPAPDPERLAPMPEPEPEPERVAPPAEPERRSLAASAPPPAPRAEVPVEEDLSEELDYDDDDDLDWRPNSGYGRYMAGALGFAGMLAVLGVCGGGALTLWLGFSGTAAESEQDARVASALAEEEAPEVAEAPEEEPEEGAEEEAEPAKAASRTPKSASRSSDSRASSAPQRSEPSRSGSASTSRSAPPSTTTAAVAPTPAPSRSSSSERTRSAAPEPYEPEPYEPAPYERDPYGDDATADLLAYEPEPAGTAAELEPGADLGDLSRLNDAAFRGGLADAERSALQAVDEADPQFTAAHVLLYQDAKARDDRRAQRRYLDAVMALPENQYNPQLLVEEAAMAIQARDYRAALEKARLAERHWARLPSDAIFDRKSMIYEIQAAAYQGLFYDSEGDDLDALQNAIRGWERFQRHVQTRSRHDLSSKADEQLTKLYEMQRRLE